ncbi:MAG: hypothetical protein JST31_00710 [Actinobacteria bacterium]|nr:hypothetical protein [Actinomycetota bacterium]
MGTHPSLQRPSESARFHEALDRSLLARIDSFEAVVADASAILASPRGIEATLRELAEASPDSFHVLSSVLAGAYLILPEVRQAIGYPGQERRFARFDESAEQLMNGILDPVIERGPIFRQP